MWCSIGVGISNHIVQISMTAINILLSVILFTLSPPNKSKSSYILELSINTAAVCIVVKTYDIANWIEGITTNRLLALGYLARRAQGFIRQQKGDDKPKQTGTK